MITMMIRIVPSDMALSPRGGRRTEIRHAAHKRKAYPALWFQRRNLGAYFGCSFSAAELMQ